MASEDSAAVLEKLAGMPIFREFTPEEITQLVLYGTRLDLKPQTHAVVEGDPSRGLFLILKGTLSVLKTDAISQQLIRIAHLETNDSFGEMSLFDTGPRSATVVADAHSELFYLDQQKFEEFLNKQGDNIQVRFYRACATDLASRFRQLNQEYISTQKLLWRHAFSKSEST